MKYFLDTEFLEGIQKGWFGKSKPIIDLISIGLICEDGREFYAISKDFNLKEAWNRYDLKPDIYNGGMKKEYWIKENVLKSIFNELVNKWALEEEKANRINCSTGYNPPIKFNYSNFKKLINKYGKTNKQIAEEIKEFTGYPNYYPKNSVMRNSKTTKPEFYGYYSDYDWVVFCWLFGKMIDLPKGFPMYCYDLKQILDEKAKSIPVAYDTEMGIKTLKLRNDFPKQVNEHNALQDAHFNYNLYKFLQII